MSKPLQLSDASRAYLVEMRSLAVDQDGAEVLIGLTRAESEEYLAHGESWITGAHTTREQNRRYLEMHERHEAQRLQVVFAEVELRETRGPRH